MLARRRAGGPEPTGISVMELVRDERMGTMAEGVHAESTKPRREIASGPGGEGGW